jgi:hypothetical protein
MVHPVKDIFEDKEIDEIDKISATLGICTLYKGLPHGIALIEYTDPESKYDSFRGLGIFDHGRLHSTPFTYVDGNGEGASFSKMQNGRPADRSYYTGFNPNKKTQHVDSLEEKTDVSGW